MSGFLGLVVAVVAAQANVQVKVGALCIFSPGMASSRLAEGDRPFLTVSPGGCTSSSFRVGRLPKLTRTGPRAWKVEGGLELQPPAGAVALADCGGGTARLELEPLARGRHTVTAGGVVLQFDVPTTFEGGGQGKCARPPAAGAIADLAPAPTGPVGRCQSAMKAQRVGPPPEKGDENDVPGLEVSANCNTSTGMVLPGDQLRGLDLAVSAREEWRISAVSVVEPGKKPPRRLGLTNGLGQRFLLDEALCSQTHVTVHVEALAAGAAKGSRPRKVTRRVRITDVLGGSRPSPPLDLKALMAERRKDVECCLKAQRQEQPGQAGLLKLTLTIDQSGHAELERLHAARDGGTGGEQPNPPLAGCLVHLLELTTFPGAEGGTPGAATWLVPY